MRAILSLAWKSLMNRKGSVILTLVAVALSVALFLGVEKARTGAREGFGNTISGTDLIVGAPTGTTTGAFACSARQTLILIITNMAGGRHWPWPRASGSKMCSMRWSAPMWRASLAMRSARRWC